MRSIPPGLVFDRASALNAGWTDSAIHHAVKIGTLTRIRRGQYSVAGGESDPAVLAIAAARSCGTSVISERSAALMHGLPILGPAPARPDITVNPSRTGDTTGALLHRARLWPDDVVELDGTPVTSIARMVVDLGRASAEAGVVAADHALHHGLVTMNDLHRTAARCRGWPGIRSARLAIDLSDPLSESPLESRSRYRLARAGFPTPSLQTAIFSVDRAFLGRVDFYWDDYGVVGEADGLTKYVESRVLTREKLRQEGLERAGLVVVRWGTEDLKGLDALLRRLNEAFRAGARRDALGLPRNWVTRARAAA